MIFTPAVVVAGLKIPSSLGVNSVELGSNVEATTKPNKPRQQLPKPIEKKESSR